MNGLGGFGSHGSEWLGNLWDAKVLGEDRKKELTLSGGHRHKKQTLMRKETRAATKPKGHVVSLVGRGKAWAASMLCDKGYKLAFLDRFRACVFLLGLDPDVALVDMTRRI